MSNPTLQANFSANTAGFTQGMSVLRQRLTELNTQMEQNRQEIRTANSQIREYRRELEQLKAATNNGTNATQEQARRMQQLRDNIATTTSRLGVLRTTEQDLRGSIRNTNSEIQNQQSALAQVTSSAATMGDVLKANLYSSGIQAAAGKLTSSLKSVISYCYNVGASFEAAMSQVEAISGASGESLEALTNKAKELGASTKFTATEAAQAMNYMAMAGWDAEQMLAGIDGVIGLAAASGGDLAEVSDIVTDAITAFGMKAEDVGHFADVLAAASANANTNVSMMGETFKYCAPIAGALGFSVEDVAEAIGLMANSGIKSTMAGTALRTTLTKLSEGVTITGEKLGEIEIKTSNADGTMRSLKDILNELRTAFDQLTPAEKSSAAESIAGKHALSGFLALMNSGAEDIDKLRGAIENCDGAAANMAETMTQNTAGAVTIMKSALEGLGLAVYDKFGEALKGDIEGFTDIFADLKYQIESGELDEVFERVAASVGKAADQLIRYARDGLPKFIEGLANVIAFLVEYRNVVAGVISTMITLKASMAVAKTVVSLVGSIKGLVVALKSMRTASAAATAATEAHTAAQIANNIAAKANPYIAAASAVAALAGGIIALVMTTDTATESVEDLNAKAEELNATAQEADEAARGVHDLVEEYKNIKTASDDTKEAKERLKEIQGTLVSTYDVEAEKLDLVNGKYQEQLGLLEKIAGEKDETARLAVNAAYYADVDAQKKAYSVELSDNNLDKETFANVASANFVANDKTGINATISKDGKTLTFDAGTSYNDIEKYLQEFGSALDTTLKGNIANSDVSKLSSVFTNASNALVDVSAAATRFAKNTELYDYYQDWYDEKHPVLPSPFGDDGDSSGGDDKPPAAGLSSEQKSARAKEARDLYKYYHDVKEISDEQYAEVLEYIRDTYYDYFSDEWKNIDLEISKLRNQSSSSGDNTLEEYTEQEKLLKWRLDMGYITESEYYEKLAQLRDRYLDESSDKWRSATLSIHKYQLKNSEKTLDKIKAQYNEAIAAIDEEIKQRERDREDEDLNSKIADVEKQLQYARLDDFSRQQLEQKKDELLREKEDIEWERGKEAQKDSLETVYTMAKEAYESGAADLQNALNTASIVFQAIGTGAENTASAVSAVTNYNAFSFAMSAVSQTSDQIAAAVVKAISSSL